MQYLSIPLNFIVNRYMGTILEYGKIYGFGGIPPATILGEYERRWLDNLKVENSFKNDFRRFFFLNLFKCASGSAGFLRAKNKSAESLHGSRVLGRYSTKDAASMVWLLFEVMALFLFLLVK